VKSLLLFMLGGIVIPLAVNELGELFPWLARRLVRWSARRLGEPSACERYEEEWLANLECVPGKLMKLVAASSYLVSVPKMRWTLQRGRRGLRARLLSLRAKLSRRRPSVHVVTVWCGSVWVLIATSGVMGAEVIDFSMPLIASLIGTVGLVYLFGDRRSLTGFIGFHGMGIGYISFVEFGGHLFPGERWWILWWILVGLTGCLAAAGGYRYVMSEGGVVRIAAARVAIRCAAGVGAALMFSAIIVVVA
jgi:hypothetical protein